MQNLRLGEFFYDKASETKWIITEEFRTKIEPQRSSFAPSKTVKARTKEINIPLLVTTLLGLIGFSMVVVALLI